MRDGWIQVDFTGAGGWRVRRRWMLNQGSEWVGGDGGATRVEGANWVIDRNAISGLPANHS